MNRREFLQVLGVGTGAAFIGADVIHALAAPDLPMALRTADAAPQDPVAHILNRVTFGPRPGQVDAVKKMGLQAYLDQQLTPATINDDASEKRLSDYATLSMSNAQLVALGDKQVQEIIGELDSATILRATYSERQLFEVMVDFWSEHFSIWDLKAACRYFTTVDNREVTRRYALSNFRDILGASAQSPAMLIFLDNAQSQKAHPNENYAREIMELHTLGVGNYTEDDVKEIARCFTGWTIDGPKRATPDVFVFNPGIHDDGAKTVLGQAIPAGGGIKDGETVLDILAAHPATAQHISTKLCRRFIGDNPPDSIVKATAQTFLSSKGDIQQVLRTIFASQEFLNAPPKYKRPFEYLISLYRAFDVELTAFASSATPDPTPKKIKGGVVTINLLKTMGHLPFDHPTPEGYNDFGVAWISNMLLRWNAAIALIGGGMPGATINLGTLVSSQNVTLQPRPVLDYFAQHLLGRPLSSAELDTLWAFATKNGTPDLTTIAGWSAIRSAITLIAASPAFQYR